MRLLGCKGLDPPLPALPRWGFDSFSLKNREEPKMSTVFTVWEPREVWQAAWGHTEPEAGPALSALRGSQHRLPHIEAPYSSPGDPP